MKLFSVQSTFFSDFFQIFFGAWNIFRIVEHFISI